MTPLAHLASLFSSLLGPLTQGQRLVRLHTPLGADVLVAERLTVLDAMAPLTADNLPEGTPAGWAEVTTGLRLEIDALAQDGHLELKRLVGQTAQVQLLTAQGLRSWHAVISRAAFLGGDGGLTRYRLTLEPWLALLAHRVDSFVFQDLTVPEILDAVFQDHVGQNLGGGGGGCQIVPQWRWDLADPVAYPRRSLCIQHNESDLDFVLRLCREEGIAFWFEHTGSDDNAAHTLVLSDHGGAYRANPEATVRYTGLNQKSGGPFQDDSLQRVFEQRRAHPQALHWLSRDHRSTQLRPVQALGAGTLPITLADVPGAYAYPSQAQGQRLLDRQLEACQAQAQLARAAGPWREAAPGTTVTLSEHPRVQGDLLITATLHRARNNVNADALAGLKALAGATGVAIPKDDEPLHHAELRWMPVGQAYRAPAIGPDQGFKRPTVHGLQTAIVVGEGAPIHTDRDHRIKVQFHWQRGTQSSHRLAHPSGDDNAPANTQTGTWVRVATAVAGANWGAVAVPRVGQEVVVALTGGDIDRPVVIGSAYNAPGQPNAQGALQTQGAAYSHGASPAWFPGDQSQGALQAHAHPQVLAGLKTQELASSATGQGGHNQLVLDDTPGASRLELSTTQHATRLQLGSLIHQDDNRRLDLRGHGFDLATTAHGAVRAGSGLLVSTHAKPSSAASAHQLDSREPQAQLDQAAELLHTLAHSAQAHQAKGAQEPSLQQAPAPEGPALPNQQGLHALAKSLQATQQRPGSSDEAFGGGTGSVPAWTRPDVLLASPSALAGFTPAHSVISAGATSTTVAGQDLQRIAQGQMVTTAKGDVTLYTYGRASNSNKPTQTTGIQLHAASGSVHVSALKSTLSAVADKQVSVSSTQGMVKVLAPKHVLLTAGGSALRIEPGNITLMTEGKVEFKASQKVLTGGAAASDAMPYLPQVGKWANWIGIQHRDAQGEPMAGQNYKIFFKNGTVIPGTLDGNGRARHEGVPEQAERVEYEARKPLEDKAWPSFALVGRALDRSMASQPPKNN